jgi:hypothetical protein
VDGTGGGTVAGLIVATANAGCEEVQPDFEIHPNFLFFSAIFEYISVFCYFKCENISLLN